MLKFSPIFIITVHFINVIFSSTEHNHFDEGVNRLAEVNTAMTGKYLHEFSRQYPGKTCFTSMFPVLAFLGLQALNCEESKCRKQLEMLNMPSKKVLKNTLPQVVVDFRDHSNVESKLAMKIFGNEKDCLTAAYKNTFKEICTGETGYLDFNKRTNAACEVNSWVANQTSKQTKPVIMPEQISDDISQIITNFQEVVLNVSLLFDTTEIKEKDFYVSKNKTIKLPTLCGYGNIKYASVKSVEAQVVVMAIGTGDLSFVIIRPNDPEGLPDLLEKVKIPKMFNVVIDEAKPCLARVEIGLGKAFTTAMTKQEHFFMDVGILTNFGSIFRNKKYVFISTILKEIIFSGTMKGSRNVNASFTHASFPVHKFNGPMACYILCPTGTPLWAGTYFGDTYPENISTD